MPVPSTSSHFVRGVRVAVGLTLLMAALFFLHGQAQQQVDHAHAQRYTSYRLIEELRQSSDDLTRMARTYVETGDLQYQKNYQALLAGRNGQGALSFGAGGLPWRWLSSESPRQPLDAGTPSALIERMAHAGFTEMELQQLSRAKAASDTLAQVELHAMSLVNSTLPVHTLVPRRQEASRLLFDEAYHLAKRAIMQPIDGVQQTLDARTREHLEQASFEATWLRRAFLMVSLILLATLWQVFKSLRRVLGGSADEIHAHMTRLGAGEFSETPTLHAAQAGSVMGGLARTQRHLKAMDEAKRTVDAKLHRLTSLYAALSQCRRAILRCTDQATLFEQVCRIAVQDGGMRMAWVGVPDAEARVIQPVAFSGPGGAGLGALKVPMDVRGDGTSGPSAQVLATDQPYWCQDYLADPLLVRWWSLAEKYGWVGMAVLPLHRDAKVVAVFCVYAAEVDAFDSQTQSLLQEMAADFDDALRSFDQEAARLASQKKDELGRFLLQRLVSDATLPQILNDFVLRLQEMMPGTLGSILLRDEDGLHLRLGAAPDLPDFYNAAVDGLPVGPHIGSCGAAAATGGRVVVEDIASHPNWAAHADLAARAGLASCWSEPILSGSKSVLGTFAIYHATPTLPGPQELSFIGLAADLCAIAIERKDAEVQLQLKARVFEQGNEAIVITDAQRRIVRVNRAFSLISGYSEAEAWGRNPRMLSSGRQDAHFYKAMWAALEAQDHWQGELWNRRKDGTEYPQWLSLSTVRDRDGAVMNYVGIASDISQSKEDEARIQRLADFDALTGLPNRRVLQDRVSTALSHAQRAGQSLALMFVDLDRFKNVNDSLGHHVGDELLIQIAQRLRSVLREQDTVCRLGGDEFVLLCLDTDASGAGHVATKLLACASERFHLAQQELSVTLSIGIALYPQDGLTFDDLSMRADAAMYRAKHAGRNAYCYFTAEMQAQSSRTLQLENALSRAVELQQLHLVYQPQIALADGHLVGVEALLRWQHPTLGGVSPAEFIPVAEESGLILPIGEWVLRTAATQLRTWQQAGLAVPLMAVNLSAIQFRQVNLPGMVSKILDETGLAPQCLELELTEGVAMNDPLQAIAIMKTLDKLGVRMSIDDFGTGYSSLSYLKRFSAYKLKIDQSFVRDIAGDADDRAIVVAIIAMARSLGFKSIAEGVETPEQLLFLREQGCDEAQGYLYSKPLPVAQFEAFYRQHQAG